MKLVELPMLLASSDSDSEESDDYKSILRRNGIDTGENEQEEDKWQMAWINLDHLTALYPGGDDPEAAPAILELMGVEIVVNVPIGVVLTMIGPESTNTTS